MYSRCLGGDLQTGRFRPEHLWAAHRAVVVGLGLVLAVAEIGELRAMPLGPTAITANIEAGQNSNRLYHRVAVFDNDDRAPVPKKFASLKKKIGLLYNGESEILCTAFCVAPNIIATAAHCLFGSSPKQKPRLANFSFRIDHNKETIDAKLAGSGKASVKQNILAGTTGLRTTPPMDAPRDWALAKLQTPACKFGALKVAPKPLEDLVTAADHSAIFQIAFHWDYEHWKLAFSGPCGVKNYSGRLNWNKIRKLFSNPESLVLHTCDTGGASSGSPLFVSTTEGPVVVGINVGTYEQSNVLLKSGKVIRRSRAEVIANTGVNAHAFFSYVEYLRKADIIRSGQDLAWLQTALKHVGLYDGNLDGHFGPRTKRAIMAYESQNSRLPTGLPTQIILQELTGLIIEEAQTQPSALLEIADSPTVVKTAPAHRFERKPSSLSPSRLGHIATPAFNDALVIQTLQDIVPTASFAPNQ